MFKWEEGSARKRFINTENDGLLNLDYVVKIYMDYRKHSVFNIGALTHDNKEIIVKSFSNGEDREKYYKELMDVL